MKNVYLLLRHGHSWANEKHLIVSTMVCCSIGNLVYL